MYKVTLSMPIYNVAAYVERALLSALNQTFESIEFLLVDDRGTDNSMDIVRRIIKEHPRGKYVRIIEHPHNIGVGAARNTAIDNAQGEYLFFMDSDDEITPDCIQVLYDKMMEEKVDMVVGSYDDKLLNGTTIERIRYQNLLLKGKYKLAKYIFTQRGVFHMQLWNKLYNIQFLKKNNIRCSPSHSCEDYNVFSDITFKTFSCCFINNVTLLYLIRDDSTTGLLKSDNITLRGLTEFLETLKHNYSYLNLIHSKNLFVGYSKFLINDSFVYLCRLLKSKNIELKYKKEIHHKFNKLIKSSNINKSPYDYDIRTNTKYLILKLPCYIQSILVKAIIYKNISRKYFKF